MAHAASLVRRTLYAMAPQHTRKAMVSSMPKGQARNKGCTMRGVWAPLGCNALPCPHVTRLCLARSEVLQSFEVYMIAGQCWWPPLLLVARGPASCIVLTAQTVRLAPQFTHTARPQAGQVGKKSELVLCKAM